MKRRTTAIAAALLLVALVFTGCNPSASGSGGNSSASSMMKAMAQAVATADLSGNGNSVSVSGNTVTVTDFTADDGTRISGTIERDADGNIIAATLSFINPDGTKGPQLVLKTAENGSHDVTYDDRPVSGSVPEPMTRDQRIAFGGLIMGFEEAFDELNDELEEVFEYYEKLPAKIYTIDSRWNDTIRGTVKVERERGDDDMHITAADIEWFKVPISRGGTVEGSYNFMAQGDDNMEASVSVKISGFRETDDGLSVELSDISINARLVETEVRDDDKFSFDGTISGSYAVNGKSHEVLFDGIMEAWDDDFFSFPSYTLTIDGESIAIGRYEKSRH